MGILQPLDDTASLLVDLVQRIKDMCIDDFQCTAETGLKLWKKKCRNPFLDITCLRMECSLRKFRSDTWRTHGVFHQLVGRNSSFNSTSICTLKHV